MTNKKAHSLKSKSATLLSLLFFLFFSNYFYAAQILPTDTIRIDGRIVVVEKEEVEDLQEIPQEQFKDKIKLEKYFLPYLSWGISPYKSTTLTNEYQQINEFIEQKDRFSPNNLSAGLQFGFRLKSGWLFESGISFSYYSFQSISFDIGELNDSILNHVPNYTFEGFFHKNNELYQLSYEHFDLGYEERENKLSLNEDKNQFIFINLPILLGKTIEVNKNLLFNLKGGVINSFVISSKISPQYLINPTSDFKIINNISSKKYIPEFVIEPSFSILTSSKKNRLNIGLYGIKSATLLSQPNDYLSFSRIQLGLKIGLIHKIP